MLKLFGRRGGDQVTASEIVAQSRRENDKTLRYIERTIGVAVPELNDAKGYLEAGSKKIWASFRACHITASFFLTTEFKIRSKGNKVEVQNPELNQLMMTPNPFDSWEELLYQWVFHIKLTGNAYWLKDEMDGRGRPKNVYPLIPHLLKIYPHETERVSHYEYGVGGKKIRLERDEVIMFRRPHPMRSIGGLGDVEGGEDLFKEFIQRNDLEQKFMENGAMPSGILSKEEEVADQTQWEKLKTWWDSKYSGKKNAGRTAFLNGKWTYTKLGLSQTEMQSLERDKWSVNEIFITHGVPLSIAGIEGASNYATSRQDEINFRRYEILPLVDMFVGKVNSASYGKSLIEAYNPNWEMSYEMSGLVDVEAIVREYTPALREGAMTRNELREMMGLGRDENNPYMDQYFVTSNLIPLELAGFAETEPAAVAEQTTEQVADSGGDVQRTALNGAQIASLQAILTDVITGYSTPELARAAIQASFPSIPDDVLDDLIAAVAKVQGTGRPTDKTAGELVAKAGIVRKGK